MWQISYEKMCNRLLSIKEESSVMLKEMNEKDLEQILGEGKVLVDFYSTNCGPCKMLGFVLSEVAKEVSEDIKIVKINFDENKEAIDKYGVEGYPTLILFNNGQEVKRMKGLQQKTAIIKMLNLS